MGILETINDFEELFKHHILSLLSPTRVALPPVSSSSHPGKEVPIGQHEQKEPFPGSPGRHESKAGFEEPAKGGEALALKMLLQFGTGQSQGTAEGREESPCLGLPSRHPPLFSSHRAPV